MAHRRRRTSRTPHSRIELLENRRLFATINVESFGAVPNDGLNDSSAIQAAIRQSSTGDTIYFPAGEYDISSTVDFYGGRKYVGDFTTDGTTDDNGATLKVTNKGIYAVQSDDVNNANLDIENLNFDTGGIKLESYHGPIENTDILNCGFTNPVGTGVTSMHMIYSTSGLDNANLSNNTFKDCWGEGMLLYDLNNTKIENNYFNEVSEGIHYLAFRTDMNSGVQISHNTFLNVSAIAIETGSNNARVGNGLVIAYNQIGGYEVDRIDQYTFALSIVNLGNDTDIHDNTIEGPANITQNGKYGPGVRIGIEMAGYGTVAENNDICGTNAGFSVETGNNEVVRDNILCGQNTAISFSGRNQNTQVYGNTYPTTCDCQLTDEGGAPIGPGGGDDGSEPPPSAPTGIAPLLSAYALSATRVSLSWSDATPNLKGFYIEREIPGKDTTFSQIEDTTTDTDPLSLTFIDQELPAGTYVYYRVRAVDTSGNIGPYSNIAIVKTLGVANNAAITRAYTGSSDNAPVPELDPNSVLTGVVDTGNPELFA